MKFKILTGVHSFKNPKAGEPNQPKSVKYEVGDVFESDIDLVRRYGPERFAYVADVRPVTAPKPVTPLVEPPAPKVEPGTVIVAPPESEATAADGEPTLDAAWGDLEKKTKDELLEIGEAEEVDLSRCKTKHEMVDLLRKKK